MATPTTEDEFLAFVQQKLARPLSPSGHVTDVLNAPRFPGLARRNPIAAPLPDPLTPDPAMFQAPGLPDLGVMSALPPDGLEPGE